MTASTSLAKSYTPLHSPQADDRRQGRRSETVLSFGLTETQTSPEVSSGADRGNSVLMRAVGKYELSCCQALLLVRDRKAKVKSGKEMQKKKIAFGILKGT